MGTTTVYDLKAMIWMNIIKNNVVATDDVSLATKSCGMDVGEIRGKTARISPTTVVINILEIPYELLEVQQDLTVSMEILTVNSLMSMSTITHGLYYRTAQYFAKPVSSIYKVCMDKLMAVYKRSSFYITDIQCNNEFCKVVDPFLAT